METKIDNFRNHLFATLEVLPDRFVAPQTERDTAALDVAMCREWLDRNDQKMHGVLDCEDR